MNTEPNQTKAIERHYDSQYAEGSNAARSVQWQCFRLVGIRNTACHCEHCHQTPLIMSSYFVIPSVDQSAQQFGANAIVHQLL